MEPTCGADSNRVDDPSKEYELRLYLAGHSPKSVRAVENLRRAC